MRNKPSHTTPTEWEEACKALNDAHVSYTPEPRIYTVPASHTHGGSWTAYTPVYTFDTTREAVVAIEPKCECGSASLNSDRHSDYCPLYLLQDAVGGFRE